MTHREFEHDPVSAQHAPAEPSFAEQLKIAAASFWASSMRNRILSLAAALLVVILVTAYGQIELNRWNAPFYNALEQRDGPEFVRQIGIFGIIASALLLLNVLQTWLDQLVSLSMREGLSRDIVDQWLCGRRAYRLSVSSLLGVNPDQRLHEDARKLAEMTASLTIGLVQATILLVSFIGVLWQLSAGFVFHLDGRAFMIPGYMVWGALLYAGTVSLFTQVVGSKLTRLNADRYAREAALRFTLMRANENLEAIALTSGEETERRHIHDTIDTVLAAVRKLVTANTHLKWVTGGFGWLAILVPILIAAPAYFAGDLTFGGLMMAAAAFNQVYAALRWFVDNYSAIADWRAALYRVMVFRAALVWMDGDHADSGAIEVHSGPAGQLSLLDLEIHPRFNGNTYGTAFRVREDNPVILAGERVMINGDQGINRKLLFNAIAGLWNWGSGTVLLPQEDRVIFVPQLEYLPEGRLRSVLAYPQASATFTDEDMAGALKGVGLERLGTMLDERTRWDRLLDKDEQMALAFAGLLLRKPRWIVFNDVLEGLEPDTVATLVDAMRDLDDATLVYIGRSDAFAAAMNPRLLHLQQIHVKQSSATDGEID